jgi:hypothetical protein
MIDDLARTAVDDLRAATRSDVEAGLLEVYAGHRRRRSQNVWTAAAAVVLALGVGWWGGHAMAGRAPAPPQPIKPPADVAQHKTCSAPVRCLGNSTYRFALTLPVTWHVPNGYDVNSGTGATQWLVESYAQTRSEGGGPYQYDTVAGVTVQEGVRAASADGDSVRSDVADTPHAFVSWLAGQPYVEASSVERARVDGRPAWHVRVTLAHGAGLGPAICNNQSACYATTITPDHHVTGIWGDMVADYTAFHVPGAGTTVVWSWAFSHDRTALARNRSAVRGLSWPSG